MDFNEAQTMITARQQGAAPDRLQLRSLRSCLAAVSALPAAGELGRSAAARGVDASHMILYITSLPSFSELLLRTVYSSRQVFSFQPSSSHQSVVKPLINVADTPKSPPE